VTISPNPNGVTLPKDNKGQFHWTVRENGKVVADQIFDDPFVTCSMKIKGWRASWLVLRGRFKLICQMDGSRAAHRVVFTGDYTPPDDRHIKTTEATHNMEGPE